MAVTGMVDQGHTVVFDSSGSYALNKKTGRIIPFNRHAGGWNIEMELEPPARANDITLRQLAELRAGNIPTRETYGVAEYHDELAEVEEYEPRQRVYTDIKSACDRGPFGRPGTRL